MSESSNEPVGGLSEKIRSNRTSSSSSSHAAVPSPSSTSSSSHGRNAQRRRLEREDSAEARGRRLERALEMDLDADGHVHVSEDAALPYDPTLNSTSVAVDSEHPSKGTDDGYGRYEGGEGRNGGKKGPVPELRTQESFIQAMKQNEVRPRVTRMRSASPVRLGSQFGAPKVKNLPRVVNKPKRTILAWILIYLHQMIPPVFSWAPKYQLRWFLNDLIAGFSSGVYGVPQAMALGVLAGLSPVNGLYTALSPAVVYILLGPSRSMTVGPASVIALLVGNAVKSSATPELMAFSLNFFMGIIFLGLGFLRVGFLATLISMPIVVGFTSAAAVLVITTQVKSLLGLKAKSTSTIIDFFEVIIPAIRQGPVNGWAVIMSLFCLFFLISLRFHPKLRLVPGPVIVSIVCILITWLFRLDLHAKISIVGDIPSGLPVPLIPFAPSKELSSMMSSLIVITAISLVEIVSISKTFAVKAGTIINTNTELIAVGAAAVISSFFRAFPISASFSKTALNDSAGAKSQLSNVVAVLIVIFVLVFAKQAIFYLPSATLASIVVGATLSLFDIDIMRFIWRTSKRDFFVLAVTFILTLLLGPEYGVLVAVCLNIFFFLLDQYLMKTRELGQLPYEMSDALFDVIHPEIVADLEEEVGDIQEMKPGAKVPKSDGSFVIKDYFPDSFTHPHLMIIRPTDSLTYVNIDKWVMRVVSDAIERLPPQWDVPGSEEVRELRDLKRDWELKRSLALASARRRSRSVSFSQGPYANNNGADAPQDKITKSSSLLLDKSASEQPYTRGRSRERGEPSYDKKSLVVEVSSNENQSEGASHSHHYHSNGSDNNPPAQPHHKQATRPPNAVDSEGNPISGASLGDSLTSATPSRRKKHKSKHIEPKTKKGDAASRALAADHMARYSISQQIRSAIIKSATHPSSTSSTSESMSLSSSSDMEEEAKGIDYLTEVPLQTMKRSATADQLEEAVEESAPEEVTVGGVEEEGGGGLLKANDSQVSLTSAAAPSSSAAAKGGSETKQGRAVALSASGHHITSSHSKKPKRRHNHEDNDDMGENSHSKRRMSSGGRKTGRRERRLKKRHPGEEDYDDYIDALQHGELDGNHHHHHPHRSLETKRSSIEVFPVIDKGAIIGGGVIPSDAAFVPSDATLLPSDAPSLTSAIPSSTHPSVSPSALLPENPPQTTSVASPTPDDAALQPPAYQDVNMDGSIKHRPASPMLPAPPSAPKKKKEFDVSFMNEDDDYYYYDEDDENADEESLYSSIEESFTASYTMSGAQPKKQPISIMRDGKVRHAEKGELQDGDEEKVEEEANRKEIKEVAKRTRNLQGFVIIDMIHMNQMDSVVVGRLMDLYETLAKNNIWVAIARPRPITLKYLIRGGFVSLIGQDFAVDTIYSCVIRCNAVLRAAMRFQAFKLMEAEEEEEREQLLQQHQLLVQSIANANANANANQEQLRHPEQPPFSSHLLSTSSSSINATSPSHSTYQEGVVIPLPNSSQPHYDPKADENV